MKEQSRNKEKTKNKRKKIKRFKVDSGIGFP